MRTTGKFSMIDWLTFISVSYILLFMLQTTVKQFAVQDLALVLYVGMQTIVGLHYYSKLPTTENVNEESFFGILLATFLGFGMVAMINTLGLGLLAVPIDAITIVSTFAALTMANGEELFHRVAVTKFISSHSQSEELYNTGGWTIGNIFAIIASGLIFGMFHFATSMFNSNMLIVAMVFGIIQSIMLEFTGSYMGLVFGHTLWNLTVWGYNPLPLIMLVMLVSMTYLIRGKLVS